MGRRARAPRTCADDCAIDGCCTCYALALLGHVLFASFHALEPARRCEPIASHSLKPSKRAVGRGKQGGEKANHGKVMAASEPFMDPAFRHSHGDGPRRFVVPRRCLARITASSYSRRMSRRIAIVED